MIFIQFWDVDEDKRTHLNAGKFAVIMLKVSEHVALDGSARLTFEVSDGRTSDASLIAPVPRRCAMALHVDLIARPASSKPPNRWLASQA